MKTLVLWAAIGLLSCAHSRTINSDKVYVGVPEGTSHNRFVRETEPTKDSTKSVEESSGKIYIVWPLGDDKFLFVDADFKTKLNPDDVYVVDNGRFLYVWYGKDLPSKLVVKYIPNVGNAYKEFAGKVSEKLEIIGFQQGSEPEEFKSLFPEWDSGIKVSKFQGKTRSAVTSWRDVDK